MMDTYQIKTILVPTDFSETANHALDAAIELARKTNAKLDLVHVVETNTVMVPVEMMYAGMVNEQMIDASNSGLKKLASKINEEHRIETAYKSCSGNVCDNIIQSAQMLGADLIIMGTHGTSGIKEWLFGSNAFRVVNNATIPVLTINRHSDAGTIKRIVFPFNENLLTLKKLDHVIYFAKLYNASVFIFGFTDGGTSSIMSFFRNKAMEIEDVLAREGIESTSNFTIGTDYAEEILKYANMSNADLISVISYNGHNVDHILQSKPDKKLVNHSTLPVLSVPVE